MTGARKDKNNPFFKSQYADLESVINAVKEPFADNGLAFSQVMDVVEGNRMTLTTVLMHVSGETVTSTMLLPDITDCQKLGGAITYFRRYALLAIAGIPSVDDDANEATAHQRKSAPKPVPKAEPKQAPRISAGQVAALKAMVQDFPEIREEFVTRCHGSIESLEADRYAQAHSWLQGKLKEVAA